MLRSWVQIPAPTLGSYDCNSSSRRAKAFLWSWGTSPHTAHAHTDCIRHVSVAIINTLTRHLREDFIRLTVSERRCPSRQGGVAARGNETHPKLQTHADMTPQTRSHLLNLLNCVINQEPKAMRDNLFTQHTNTININQSFFKKNQYKVSLKRNTRG